MDLTKASPRDRALRPFHVRIGLAIGALVVASGVGIAFLLGAAAQDRILRLESDHLESTASHLARELGEGMDQFSRDVVSQTYRERFRGANVPVEDMREALDEFQRLNPHFAYASIVDVATQRVIAATGGVFEGGSAKGRPTFERALERPFLGDVHDAVRLAELLPKPVNGEGLRFLDVSAPIKNSEGRTYRVFAAHVAWDWTRSLRDSLFRPLKETQKVELLLLDTASKVVLAVSPEEPVGTDLSAIAASQVGKRATVVVWPNGREYLFSVIEVQPHGAFPGFGWKVVARQPKDVALVAVRELRNAFMLGSLGLSLFMALLGWYLAGRLSRPMRQLAEVAEHAEAGRGLQGQAERDTDEAREVHTVRRAISRLAHTARAEADASMMNARQFAALVQTLPQAVWVADGQGWLEYANRDWLKPATPGEPFNIEEWGDFVLDEDRADFARTWLAALARGTAFQHRCRFVFPEAKTVVPEEARWYDFDATPVANDERKVVRWIGTLCDVHDLITLAQATERALEQERAARTATERLARMQDEFLAVVSHELRSPLNAIMGWGELLRKRANGDPMVSKAGAVIQRNTNVQAALINDLMDMSAVMVGKLQVQRAPLDLTALSQEVVLSHLHTAQHKGIDLAIKDKTAVIVEADARRMSQVLSNLIGNALKFTDSGGKVEVMVWADRERAWARVSDTGCGIAPEFLPHVFDRLRQEDSSTTRRAGGLGLGLTIAQALVRLHGGEITVDSPGAGQGATFVFSIPLAVEGNSEQPPVLAVSSDVGPELSGLRILLVDDEDDAREVANVAFASLGAHVVIASNGYEALSMLGGQDFDVMVTDIGMPGLDGFQLLQEVRRRVNGRELPVVALTAFALESHAAAGRRAGFDAYVTKPISLRRLAEGVVLAKSKHRQAADAGTVEGRHRSRKDVE